MGSCSYQDEDNIFVLTLHAGDAGGHNNYLTLELASELLKNLREIRSKGENVSSFKGLITNGGALRDGVDYENMEEVAVVELSYLVAEAARELYNMPFPTVAAVTGDVRSSLAMALVLAHDEIAATEGAVFEAAELRQSDHDHLPPPYLASMLRDRAQYAGMRTDMVLRSKPMTSANMHYWEVFEPSIAEGDVGGLEIGKSIIKGSFGDVRDGKAFITTRNSFFPEASKAISDFLAQ